MPDTGRAYLNPNVQIVDANGKLTLVAEQQLRQVFQQVSNPINVFADLHANRVAFDVGPLPTGTLFYETDRTVFYVLLDGAWAFAAGRMSGTRAAAPTDLDVEDAGFQMYVSDYHHLVMWTGTAWQFGPGDDGAAYFRDFYTPPSPAAGWELCDGSPTSYLVPAATLLTVNFATPNLVATPAYRKGGGAYSGAIVTGGGALAGGGASDPAHITVLPYFRR